MTPLYKHTPPTKTCTKCGGVFPWAYFDHQKRVCPDCRNKHRRKTYNPRGRVRIWPDGFRICSRKNCSVAGELQPTSGFNKDPSAKDGLRSECKLCERAYGKKHYPEYRDANLEHLRKWNKNNQVRKKQWLERCLDEHPDYRKTICFNFYLNNRKKLLLKAKEKRVNNLNQPNEDRNSRLRARGANSDWYDKTLAAQHGVCEICRSPDSGYPTGRFAIDHDHGCCKPGRSCDRCRRGLLCNRCNTWIERFEKYPEIVERAVWYLNKYRLSEDGEVRVA